MVVVGGGAVSSHSTTDTQTQKPKTLTPVGGCRESRRCARDTYPESYITKDTGIRRLTVQASTWFTFLRRAVSYERGIPLSLFLSLSHTNANTHIHTQGSKASDAEVAEANALGSKQWEELVPP